MLIMDDGQINKGKISVVNGGIGMTDLVCGANKDLLGQGIRADSVAWVRALWSWCQLLLMERKRSWEHILYVLK